LVNSVAASYMTARGLNKGIGHDVMNPSSLHSEIAASYSGSSAALSQVSNGGGGQRQTARFLVGLPLVSTHYAR
jgi:hypothetical protein